MVCPTVFASIFNNNPDLVNYTGWAIRIYMAGIFAMGFQLVCQQSFMALGQAKISLLMACLRKLKAGRSVFIFAEGETSWDGRTQDIFPGIGRMAKIGGVQLLTYRLEGGYLSAPRWGKGIRRGRMQGRIAGVYSPEQLKAMKPEETTKGGLILTSASKEKPEIAEVLAVGPGGMVDGKEVAMQVKAGDRVVYSKYAGTEVKLDNEEFVILKQNDILAIVK